MEDSREEESEDTTQAEGATEGVPLDFESLWLRDAIVAIQGPSLRVDVEGTYIHIPSDFGIRVLDGAMYVQEYDTMEYNLNPKVLAESCMWNRGMNGPYTRPRAEAEGQNTWDTWQVVDKWFKLMESGEADMIMPDPTWIPREGFKPLDQELADSIIYEMDEDFLLERSRMNYANMEPPEFSRLGPEARMAFAQELMDVLMLDSELDDIEEEAKPSIGNDGVKPANYGWWS